MKKPLLSKASIWNMSVGFLGIQMGFALQNSNASRILQTFGADTHELSWFWLVAPLTGLIVQPIIGTMSDSTWTKLGRRKPYFLVGAILSAIGLILMPNASMFTAFLPVLWIGAGMLMIMDASFNVAMEPFRALVADNLPSSQRTEGFSAQTALIGIGSVVGSWLPYILAEWFGVAKTAPDNAVPPNLVYSFMIGAIVLLGSILYTISKTKEYSPQELASFTDHTAEVHSGGNSSFIQDLLSMPRTMAQLGIVQFFSWFGLFCMWVYTTSAVAQHVYALPADDNKSEAFNDAGNWVGIIFGVYNAVSAIYAFYFLPKLADKYGRKQAHAISLVIGALGFFSMYLFPNKHFLIISMIGVGIAWASILAMPYAILGGAIPPAKMGFYMGIFNMFITIPQIISAISGGFLLKYVYHDKAIYAIVMAGICFLMAAFCTRFVNDVDEVKSNN
jgi:maltose/moltooligosaccharide transporter